MSKKIRTSRTGVRLSVMGVALAAALLSMQASAVGLGALTVLSSLGQPLRAEIELVAPAPEKDGPLVVRLASVEVYRRANVEFGAVLASVRFSVETNRDKPYIRVSSSQPMNELFVDLMVELTSNNGSIIRDYTFLLDPVNPLQIPLPVIAAENAPVPKPGAAQMQSVVPLAAAAQTNVPAAGTPPPLLAAPVATAVKPATPTAQPPARVATSAPIVNRAPAAPTMTPPAAPAVSKPRLTLSSANSAAAGNPSMEDYVHIERALAESNARVRALEQKVSEMVKLSVIMNRLLVNLQEQQDLAKAAGKPSAAPGATAGVPAAAGDKKPDASVIPSLAPLSASASASPATPATATVTGAATPAAASAPAGDSPMASPVDPALAPVPAPPPTLPVPPVAKALVKPPQPTPEPSLFEDPLLLPGAGLLLALFGGLGAYFYRRKKDRKQFAADLYLDTTPAPSSERRGPDGGAGGAIVVAAAAQVQAQPDPAAGDPAAGDPAAGDPLAEADIYLAYGREAQAEGVLRAALLAQPGYHDVRLKLMSILAARSDTAGFDALARELSALTQGEGAHWAQAVAMRLTLAPAHPLYAGHTGSPHEAAEPVLEDVLLPLPPASGNASENQEVLQANAAGAAGASSQFADLPDLAEATAIAEADDFASLPGRVEAGDIASAAMALEIAREAQLPSTNDDDPVASDSALLPSLSSAAMEDEAIQVEEVSLAAAPEELLDLDFDLDSAPAPVSAADAPLPVLPVAAPGDATASSNVIEFDFDLPDIPVLAELQEDEAIPATKGEPALASLDSLDFDFAIPQRTPTDKP